MERPRLATVALVLAGLPAAGCAAGSPSPDAVGYVLLDREAQASGRLTHGDWSGAPLLPVALDAAEPAELSTAAGTSTIHLRPGWVAWVRGAGGAVEWRSVGDDVSEDQLRVHGSRDAAATLAHRLAGQLLGPAAGQPGAWTISAPDVFDRSSFLAPPEGITEITPEPKLDLAPEGHAFGRRAVLSDTSAGLSEPARQARMVGLYTAGDLTLFLDAEGGFALDQGCNLDAVDRGRWHTDGDQVVLSGQSGRRVLAYDPTMGDLADPGGGRFSCALVDSIVAAMPREEP